MDSLDVALSDGSVHTVDPRPADYVRFERHFSIPMSSLDAGNASFEHMMFLAFLGLKRQNIYRGTFDEFIDFVDSVAATPKAETTTPAETSPPEE